MVYMQKKGLVENDAGEPARWGNLLEPVVADEYTAVSGHRLLVDPTTYRHPKYPIFGHVDRVFADKPWIYEGKTISAWRGKELGDDDEMPNTWLVQCQVYMGLTGRENAVVAALVGGNKLWTRGVPRNDELIEQLFDAANQWWQDHILADVPPPAVTDEDIRALYPESMSKTVVATPEIVTAVNALRDIKEQLKELKVAEGDLKVEIQNHLQDAEVLLSPSGGELVTWKSQDRRAIDQGALKKSYPEIANEITKTTSSRVLRLKKRKSR